MGGGSDIESEVKSWLEIILEKENVKNLCVKILENSETGNVCIGDVVFVDVTGTAASGSPRKYNLVLKCNKRSRALREQSITKEAFLNEIYIYDTLMPVFTQFQQDRKVADHFDSVPKCYGVYTGDNIEVIALGNLKELGYSLWEKTKPLPRSHINKVLEEYGKFHAVSIAMQHEHPETFQKFEEHFNDIAEQVKRKDYFKPKEVFSACIKEVYNLLKDDLEDIIMEKWNSLEQQVDFIFGEMFSKEGVKVVTHGDCWNNNFMYCYDEVDKTVPTKLAILDWQRSRFVSPIVDLSYFIFASISEDDLEDMESILENYHKSFSRHLTKLGTDPDSVYSFKQLLEDWRNYCKYGILVTSFIFKICLTEENEVVDKREAAEEYKIRNTRNFRNRMKIIIQHVVKHGLI